MVGGFIGYLATIYYARETDKIKSEKQKKDFEPIAGEYNDVNGYATAKMKYINDNKLKIEITTHLNYPSREPFPQDEIQIWTGDISMDATTHGFVVWAYRKPDRLIGTSGFKRIIIDEDLNGFTLVGEQGRDFSYGTERFKRKT